MNKKKNHYVVNNQEDEDGYILYPENAIINKFVKNKQEIRQENHTAIKKSCSAKQLFRSFIPSPAMLNRINNNEHS